MEPKDFCCGCLNDSYPMELEQQLAAATERAAKLQARIDEGQNQKATFYISTDNNGFYKLVDADGNPWQWSAFGAGHKFYAKPIIPPDVEELEKDAKRYRWLRFASDEQLELVRSFTQPDEDGKHWLAVGKEFDAAIDAAIRKGG